MLTSNSYLAIIVIVVIALALCWLFRSFYYHSPARRMKWHGLPSMPPLPIGPMQIGPIDGINTTDRTKWNTAEITNDSLVIKAADGTVNQTIGLTSIERVSCWQVGVVNVSLGKEKFLSTGYKNTILLDFRLTPWSWLVWTAFRGASQVLPPKWLSFTARGLIEADRQALTLYAHLSGEYKLNTR